MASIFYIHEMPLRIIDERVTMNLNLINDPKQLVNNSSNSNNLYIQKKKKTKKEVIEATATAVATTTTLTSTGVDADELCSEEDEEETNEQTQEKINERRKKKRIKERITKLGREILDNDSILNDNNNDNEKINECDLREAMALSNIANCRYESNQAILPAQEDKLGNKSKSKSISNSKTGREISKLSLHSKNPSQNENKLEQIDTTSVNSSTTLQSLLFQSSKLSNILNAGQKSDIKLDCSENVEYNNKSNNEPSQNVARCRTPALPQSQRRKYAKHRNCRSMQRKLFRTLTSFEINNTCNLECQTSQCTNNHMILTTLAQLVIIYIIITSSVVIPVTATNYWPLRKQHNQYHHHHQQQQQQQQIQLHQQQQHKLQMQTQSSIDSVINSNTDTDTNNNNNSNNNNNYNNNNNQLPRSHQLLIGQHYNNFSSIVPYSIVQDSDYVNGGVGGSDQEDQVMDEQEEQQAFGSSDISPTRIVEGITSTNLKSRALLPLDSNRLILPQMQQIKSRFNQGCVGGTKCQFFAFCWMSGGSLGASCGLLMTCCVTPSRQEIQPGFYGPVVNDPYCGRSTSKINRIVGGTDASFGQFPWQAFVQVGGSRCGGALISSRHVVTAGHCVARSQHSPSSIKVTLGDYILNSDIESIPHEVFSVVEVLLHPNFRFTPQADRYDVAVLELDRTASYKDNIKPICLPQKDAAFVGRVAYVAGWGALQAGSKLRPKVLQHVAVPVIENHVCESWHRRKGIDIRIYDEMMCAGYELGQRDACQGDSGGPLMLNQFGVWYLVGIVSAGYSCAKQYQPGIYHRVSSSSDWISSNVYQQGSNK